MQSNDQYPYYHNAELNNAHAQSDHTGYQSRPASTQQVPATQYQQHAQSNSANSASNNAQTYQENQQPQQTAQSYSDAHENGLGITDVYGSQSAAEALSRLGLGVEQTSAANVTASQNFGASASNFDYGQANSVPATAQYSSSVVLETQQNYSNTPTYASIQEVPAQPRLTNLNAVPYAGRVAASDYGTPSASRILSNVTQAALANVQTIAPVYNHTQNDSFDINADTQLTYDPLETIDPSAVYNPWLQDQKRMEAEIVAKAAQDAEDVAEEEDRKAVEAERDNMERKQQEVEVEAQEKEAEVLKKAGKDAEKVAPAQKRAETRVDTNSATSTVVESSIPATNSATVEAEDAEEQIRQLMAKVKAMNDKHPTLLAKIWEQERQEHLKKTASESPQPTVPPQVPVPLSTPKYMPPRSAQKPLLNGIANVSANTSRPLNGTNAKNATRPTGPQAPRPNTARPGPAASRPIKGSTPWPREKMSQLASTAAKLLNLTPENKDQRIEASTISDMLDRNPTFVELCEMLEVLGLKVERTSFARGLRQNVPDVNSKQPQGIVPTPSSSNTPPGAGNGTSTPKTVQVNDPSPPPYGAAQYTQLPLPRPNGLPSTSVPHSLPNFSQNKTIPPHDLSALEACRSPYFNTNGQPIPATTRVPSIPTAPVTATKNKNPLTANASKAYDSKKSSFVEIKDALTEFASQKDAARKRAFADLVDLASLTDDDMPPSKRVYTGPLPATMLGQAYGPVPNFLPNFDPSELASPYLQRGAQQWANQNGHTQYHQRPMPTQSGLIVNEQHKTVELAKPLSPRKAKNVRAYDVKTIARDILLATGKHPDMLPLNGHLEPLKTVYPKQIETHSDLTTLRWDVLDPGDPVSFDSDDRDSVIADGDADDESEDEPAILRVGVRATVGVGGNATTTSITSPPRGSIKGTFGPTPTIPRRRGRPPKHSHSNGGVRQRPFGFEDSEPSQPRSGQLHQRGDEPGRRQSSFVSVNPTASASGSGTPANNQPTTTIPASASTGHGVGYSQFRQQVDENGNPIKRRGRPVGWRKSIHMKNSPGGSSGALPLKKEASSGPPPEVRYAVYECKWESCKAKLHNLETLKKHIHKLHGSADGKGRFTCKWEGCSKMVRVVDKETGEVSQMPQYNHFPNQELLLEHVHKAHVGPVAWKLGDGPPGGRSDSAATDSESYLSDSRGRRVTPRISEPPVSAMPSSTGKLKKKTAEQLAREAEDELRRKKKAIGPGVDRGGSRLVTPKRRAGFIDDEDGEEMEVDPED